MKDTVMLTVREETNYEYKGDKPDFDLYEAEYQDYQSRWEHNPNDAKAWEGMFYCIRRAAYNYLNRKYIQLGFKERVISNEEIENQALEITLNVLRARKNKRAKGKEWKINRVISYVGSASLAIYNKDKYKQEKFEDSAVSLNEEII